MLLLLAILSSCNAGYGQNNFISPSDSIYTPKAEEFISRPSAYGFPLMYAPHSMRLPSNTIRSNYGNNMPIRNTYGARRTKYQPYQKQNNYNFPAIYRPFVRSHPNKVSSYDNNNYGQNMDPNQDYDPYTTQDSSYGQNAVYEQNSSGNQNSEYGRNTAYNAKSFNSQNPDYDQNSYPNQNSLYGQNGQNTDYIQNTDCEQNSDYGQKSGCGKNLGYDQPIQAVTLGTGAYIPGAGYIEGYPFVYLRDSYNGNLPPGVEESEPDYSSKSFSKSYYSDKPANSDASTSYSSQNNAVSRIANSNRLPMKKQLMQNQRYNNGPSQKD